VISAMVLPFWVRVILRSWKAPTKSSRVRVETILADGPIARTDVSRFSYISMKVMIISIVAVCERV